MPTQPENKIMQYIPVTPDQPLIENMQNKTYKQRFEAALDYWLSQNTPLTEAIELAHDQIMWEDSESDENQWKGPNDSQPLHSF